MKSVTDLVPLALVALATVIALSVVYNLPGEKIQHIDKGLYKEFKSAAIATSAGPCSTVGKKMLKKGGTVVDAAIAATLCVGIHRPQSAGLGGGFFMNYYDAATDQAYFINAREVAPLAGHKDMYNVSSLRSLQGPHVIAVPGEIAGYWEAHQRFGRLKWSELFEPSIKFANEGIKVTEPVERYINLRKSYFGLTGELKSLLTEEDGSLKTKGDIIFRPKLAATLRTIADKGASSFYSGELAKLIVKDIRNAAGAPSLITEKDLESYRVQVEPIMNTTLGDLTMLTTGAISGGPVLNLILNILEGYNLTSTTRTDIDSKTLTYHRIVEAFKFAYGNRMQLGDANYNKDIHKILETMLSKTYAGELRSKISDFKTHEREYYMPDFTEPPEDFGTAHISIVGEDGSAVSLTSSINYMFGSAVVAERTGIIFNNEMSDFSLPSASSPSNNLIEPGKRPLSSMCPTIILKPGPEKPIVQMVIGAAGGMKITTATALVIMNNLWFGEGLDKAVERYRIHHQLNPNKLEFEEGFDQDMIEALKKKGHVSDQMFIAGTVEAISRTSNNNLAAMCDGRSPAYADGY